MPPSLRVQVLGAFALSLSGEALSPRALSRRKLRSLLKLLALEPGHVLTRDAVIDALWADLDPAAGAAQLYNALLGLRKTLGEAAPRLAQGIVRLDPPGGLIVDAEVFRRAAEAALASRDPGALARAADLFTGAPLPEDLYEDWATPRRDALNATHLAVLEALARARPQDAEPTWRRLLAVEPAHEEAHLALLRLALDQPERLRAAFERYARARREELGAEPSPEAWALLREGEVRATRAAPAAPDRAPHEGAAHGQARPSGRRPLPVPPAPLVGRAAELEEGRAFLHDPAARLLTVVGPGGHGKTRLALELAREAARGGAFDAVGWVAAENLGDASQLASAALDALGAPSGRAPEADLRAVLEGRRTLLVLDNLEHLGGAPGWVADLLEGAEGLRVLATSRTLLRLRAERPLELGGLNAEDAAALFTDAARRVRSGFTADAAEQAALRRLTERLTGSPLGLELAASWVRAMTVAELVEEVGRDLDVLERPAPDRAARHAGLRAVFEGSWALLEEPERAALAALPVFVGSFGVAAARAVSGADRATLAALADRSLVHMDAGRLELHPLVRQYVTGEARRDAARFAALAVRHAEHYLGWARDAVRRLDTPDPIVVRTVKREVAAELPNLRRAWEHAREAGRHDLLHGALVALHDLHAHGEALHEVALLLSHTGGPDDALRARRLLYRGSAKTSLGHADAEADLDAAEAGGLADAERLLAWRMRAFGRGRLGRDGAVEEASRALDLAERLDDPAARRAALVTLGEVLIYAGRLHEADELLSRAIAAGGAGPVQEAVLLGERATLAGRLGDSRRAEADLRRSLALLEALDDVHHAQTIRLNLAVALQTRGEYAEAARLMELAEAQARDQGNQRVLTSVLIGLTLLYIPLGRHREALERAEENRRRCGALGDAASHRLTLVRLGEVHADLGRLDEAERAFRGALDAANPTTVQNARLSLAALEWRRGRPEAARAWLADVGAGRTPALTLRLHALRLRLADLDGDADGARIEAAAVLAARPRAPEPYVTWALALAEPALRRHAPPDDGAAAPPART